MTTLEAQHEVITDLILENQKLKKECDEAWKELEEYRAIAENIGAVKAVSEKEKAIRERDDARQEWGKASMDAAQLLSEKTKVIAERDEVREALMAIEDRCVDCEDACDDIQKIRDIARAALEK